MPTNLRVTTLGEIGYAFDDFRHFLLSVQVETRRNTEIKATLLVEILSETKKTNTHTNKFRKKGNQRRPRDCDRVSKCNRLRRKQQLDWTVCVLFCIFLLLSHTWWFWGLLLLMTTWLILLFSFPSFSSTQFAIFLHFPIGFLSRFFAFLKNLIERDFLFAVLVPREEEDEEEERRISHYKSQLNDLRV